MAFNSPATPVSTTTHLRSSTKPRITTTPARDDDDNIKSLRQLRERSPMTNDSPTDSPLLRRAAMSLLLGVPSDTNDDSVASWSMDDTTTTDESGRASPGLGEDSPAVSPAATVDRRHQRKKYRNELWSAIKSDYMYLMDEEIIDACKSTESELSSDDLSTESKVSYNEFVQQYKELTDWLGHIQTVIQRKTDSFSENYLNQMYQEEMLSQSPRQQLINEYARQLMRRYPQLKPEISSRLGHVNSLWAEVMNRLVLPAAGGHHDPHIMLRDIRKDLAVLREWVNKMEQLLCSLQIDDSWSVDHIKQQLRDHEATQQDIESRSRVVSAILKLCDWLASSAPEHGTGSEHGAEPQTGTAAEHEERAELELSRVEVQREAVCLEQRWHGVWIQSVEWQLRLEDAIAGRNNKSHRLDALHNLPRLSTAVRPHDLSLNPEAPLSSVSTPNEDSDAVREYDTGDSGDVIPFRDSEYEELCDDDLMFQFNGSTDSEPESARRGVNNFHDFSHIMDRQSHTGTPDDEEAGIDSALSRSVSNPSLTQNNPRIIPSPDIALSEIPEIRSEVPDVGYSSEWQSNEEADNSSAAQPPSRGLPPAADDDWKVGEVNNMRNVAGEKPQVMMSRVTSVTSGHSATSAYNSSNSDLSDGHQPNGNKIKQMISPLDLSSGVPTTAEFYHLTPIDQSVSDIPGETPNLFPLLHRDVLHDDETDEDVAKLMELPLDEIPRIGKTQPAGDGYIHRRVCGRSLDSLAPMNSEKVLVAEKRVTSVEVIIDSAAYSGSSSGSSSQPAKDRKNPRKFNGVSSCDASSEGTISDSDLSDVANTSSGDDNATGSLRKRRILAKRSPKAVRLSPTKSCSSLPVKSPTKRHVSEPASTGNSLPRSMSDGEVIGREAGGAKRSKLTRVMVCGSPKGRSGRKFGENVHSSRKTASLSHARALDFDEEDARPVTVSAGEDSCSPPQRGGRQMVSSCDVLMPDLSGSLTSITNDEFQEDMYDSGDVNHRVVDNLLSDDWCDSTADDFSMGSSVFGCHSDGKVHRRANRSLPAPSTNALDSDSDTEDFINIVSESRKAFQFTETTLAQFDRDHRAGTVVRDPAEYMGPLATCQTNVKCLLELIDALDSAARVSDVDSKIRQITDIVQRWRALEALTVTQQHECRQLFILHVERVRVERELDALSRQIEFDKFDDIQSLEDKLRCIREVHVEVNGRVTDQLAVLAQRVDRYSASHTDINTTDLQSTIQSLFQSASALSHCCETAECQLKQTLVAWYQLKELERHLVHVVSHEQHQLDCVAMATDIVDLSHADSTDTIADLRLMREGWSSHMSKLQLMESLCSELSDVCSERVLTSLQETVSSVTSDLRALFVRCDEVIAHLEDDAYLSDGAVTDFEFDIVSEEDMEEEIAADVADKMTGVAETVEDEVDAYAAAKEASTNEALSAVNKDTHVSAERQEVMDWAEAKHAMSVLAAVSNSQPTGPSPQQGKLECRVKRGSSSSVVRRLLKYALPLPFILILLFGSLYVLCDDWCRELDRYGLVLSPRFQHVGGAPPV